MFAGGELQRAYEGWFIDDHRDELEISENWSSGAWN